MDSLWSIQLLLHWREEFRLFPGLKLCLLVWTCDRFLHWLLSPPSVYILANVVFFLWLRDLLLFFGHYHQHNNVFPVRIENSMEKIMDSLNPMPAFCIPQFDIFVAFLALQFQIEINFIPFVDWFDRTNIARMDDVSLALTFCKRLLDVFRQIQNFIFRFLNKTQHIYGQIMDLYSIQFICKRVMK